MTGTPMTSKLVTALALCVAASGCNRDAVALELTGIWLADSHAYESATGEVVDIVARDGATTTVAANLTFEGWRVSVVLDDGKGNVENLFGFVENDRFIFPDAVWNYTRNGDRMQITSDSETFDFGDGSEPASLDIRLTRV